jgi:dienelactone hydrolase
MAVSMSGWDHSTFTHDGVTHETYRKGSGPAVVVVHEIPGITPKVLEFAERVAVSYTHLTLPTKLL